MYEYADRLLRVMKRRNLRLFDKLRILKFDELNIMQSVSAVYDSAVQDAKKKFLEIAVSAYIDALMLASVREDNAKRRAEKDIDDDWVLDMLEEYNPITLYRFIPEAERKKMRTAEAMLASRNAPKENDKALRLWNGQIEQYAIDITDRATMQGYKAGGIQYVKWITQEDEKVCPYCRSLHGKVFRIDRAPKKAHYRCRCYYVPAKNPTILFSV